MIRPARKDEMLVRVHRHSEKIGSIVMPKHIWNAEHNAAKFYRFQLASILMTNGNEGFNAGDVVLTRRWNPKVIDGDIATLKVSHVLAKLEDVVQV